LLPRFASLSRCEFGGATEAAIKPELRIARFSVAKAATVLRKTVAMTSELPTEDH